MTAVRWFGAVALVAVLVAPAARAQEPAKPGPEHAMLKKLEGTWDSTMKAGGMDAKGTVTYKMELGGLWLVSNMESEMFGTKFSGKGLETYDPNKKKFVSIWVDSMSAGAVTMEGTYDAAKKTMTMTGEGPGMDGKPTKYKSLTVMPDDDTMNFTMHIGDGTEPAFTIVYKRKK